jgi:hypothetical protein
MEDDWDEYDPSGRVFEPELFRRLRNRFAEASVAALDRTNARAFSAFLENPDAFPLSSAQKAMVCFQKLQPHMVVLLDETLDFLDDHGYRPRWDRWYGFVARSSSEPLDNLWS